MFYSEMAQARHFQDVITASAEEAKRTPKNLADAISAGLCSRVRAIILDNPGLIDHIFSETGMTPLILAASCAKIDIVRFLIRHGADETILDKTGRSAKDYLLLALAHLGDQLVFK